MNQSTPQVVITVYLPYTVMNIPTTKDSISIKQLGSIVRELNSNTNLNRDVYHVGWVEQIILDLRFEKPIVRLAYVFDSLPRPAMFFKAFLDDPMSLEPDRDQIDTDHMIPDFHNLDPIFTQILEQSL